MKTLSTFLVAASLGIIDILRGDIRYKFRANLEIVFISDSASFVWTTDGLKTIPYRRTLCTTILEYFPSIVIYPQYCIHIVIYRIFR